jgi:hypothetical protein
MDEPEVYFSNWNKWKYRERLADDFDTPDDFGLLGVYLLAAQLPADQELHHLAPEVIYIGMSTHVTKRLDKTHKAVCEYRHEFGDSKGEKLYYSDWLSPWSNWNQDDNLGQAQVAFIHYIERKLIWEYAKKHHALPRFNRH